MISDWGNFFVAMAGGAATLTGLLFVALSINLNRILSIAKLAHRGLESLILLLTILIVSSLCLVPGQSVALLGCEILFIALIVWVGCLKLDLDLLHGGDKEYRPIHIMNIIVSHAAILPYFACGICLLCFGLSGLYCLVAAYIISLCKSLLDAWVLLVEINR